MIFLQCTSLYSDFKLTVYGFRSHYPDLLCSYRRAEFHGWMYNCTSAFESNAFYAIIKFKVGKQKPREIVIDYRKWQKWKWWPRMERDDSFLILCLQVYFAFCSFLNYNIIIQLKNLSGGKTLISSIYYRNLLLRAWINVNVVIYLKNIRETSLCNLCLQSWTSETR